MVKIVCPSKVAHRPIDCCFDEIAIQNYNSVRWSCHYHLCSHHDKTYLLFRYGVEERSPGERFTALLASYYMK